MPFPVLGDSQNLAGNNIEKKAIPKFASFRSKQAVSAPAKEQATTGLDSLRCDDLSYSSSTIGSQVRQHSSDRYHPKRPTVYRDRKQKGHQTLQSSARSSNEREKNSPKSYIVDRCGDIENLTFDRSNRYEIPSYVRFGAGVVLGSIASQRIEHPVSDTNGLVISHKEHGSWRKSDRLSLWKATQTWSSKLKIRPQSNELSSLDYEADYLSLEAGKEVKRRRMYHDSSMESSSDSTEVDAAYRVLDGKAKTDGLPGDEDLVCASDASQPEISHDSHSNGTSTMNCSVLDKRKDFSRRVEKDPTNYDAWLKFINHQDKVPKIITGFKKIDTSNAERKSNADIKMSMYEKAIGNVKDPDGRVLLLLGRMKEAALLWDNQKLSLEWERILRGNPASLTLWKEYLNFKQTSFESFRYEEVKEAYANCFEWSKHSQVTSSMSVADREKLYYAQIYILLRMTVFMKESGFTEQAVATWQAFLEYEFFRPIDLRNPENKERGSLHGATISRFEKFWDSEVPRIGEAGCKGWNDFDQAEYGPALPKTEIAKPQEGEQSPYGLWLKLERVQSSATRMPSRTIDDGAEDDPFRVVLSSDVRLFLIDSPSPGSKAACLDAFLVFCHLPPYQTQGPSRCWWREGYLRNEIMDASFLDGQPSKSQSFEMNKSLFGDLEGSNAKTALSSSKPISFAWPMADHQLSLDTLLAVQGSWFSSFNDWCSDSVKKCGPLDKAWVLRSLRRLVVAGEGEDSLAEYLLALELCYSSEMVRKTARTLLKKRSLSLRLYNAYALIEHRLGNLSNGQNTLATAINMSKSLDKPHEESPILLWRSWVWELLIAGDSRKALNLLLVYGEREVRNDITPSKLSESQAPAPTPALVLRAERSLTATRDDLLSRGQYRYAAFAIDCLIVFHYLKSGSSFSEAASVFKSNCLHLDAYISSSHPAYESLHQSFVRLLYYHVTNSSMFKPSDIRSLLTESVKLYPQNTIFVSLYAWNEVRFRIDDRLRSIFNNVILTKNQGSTGHSRESVIPHFFAVFSELTRGVTFGSNSSTIRSTFERALESESGAHCAGLWKMYFTYERTKGNKTNARSVFWRAVRACPWAKEMYLLAFEDLGGANGLGIDDLRSAYELMVEKEIRIHVRLEDCFDNIRERDANIPAH